jgi:hypothetical protein
VGPLLKNAVESIKVGVEDYEQGSAARLASAVRNLYAGVLLLLKEKLRRLSPPGTNDALIYQRIEFRRARDGIISIHGRGTKTVDFQEIVDRYTQLGLTLDKTTLERLQKIRNHVEHHSVPEGGDEIREAVAATFAIVRDVVEDHLEDVPATLLGEETWNAMLEEADLFEEQLDRCVASLKRMRQVPLPVQPILDEPECPRCSSALIEALDEEYNLDTRFKCLACGTSISTKDLVLPRLSSLHGGSSYDAIVDGDEPPLTSCDACHERSYDTKDDVCLLCLADWNEGYAYDTYVPGDDDD